MLPLAAIMTVALVVHDGTSLRPTPNERSGQQAILWKGDWLEVRGEKRGYVQVWDHRHERPGYVRSANVRLYPLDESSAEPIRSVIDFLVDEPGAESLGIGYVALYLKVAKPTAIGTAAFDALGRMAERLAKRAAVPGHLEVAES